MSLSAPPIPLTQIHFGTGKLSVGLVVVTAVEAGGQVHVVTRASTERLAGPPGRRARAPPRAGDVVTGRVYVPAGARCRFDAVPKTRSQNGALTP